MICTRCLKPKPLSRFEREGKYIRKVCKACRAIQASNRIRVSKYIPAKPRQQCEFCCKTTTADDGICKQCSLDIYHSHHSEYVDGPITRKIEYDAYKSAAEKCICPPATRIRMRKAAEAYHAQG